LKQRAKKDHKRRSLAQISLAQSITASRTPSS
jgi:hypothetical protein